MSSKGYRYYIQGDLNKIVVKILTVVYGRVISRPVEGLVVDGDRAMLIILGGYSFRLSVTSTCVYLSCGRIEIKTERFSRHPTSVHEFGGMTALSMPHCSTAGFPGGTEVVVVEVALTTAAVLPAVAAVGTVGGTVLTGLDISCILICKASILLVSVVLSEPTSLRRSSSLFVLAVTLAIVSLAFASS